MTVAILCPEDICLQHLNTRYHFYNNNDNSRSDFDENNYCDMQDERIFDDGTNMDTEIINGLHNEDYLFNFKGNIEDTLFNEEILPNLEPVQITHNDLVSSEWTKNDAVPNGIRNDNVLLELNNSKNDIVIEENIPTIDPIQIQNIQVVALDNSINLNEIILVNDFVENTEDNIETLIKTAENDIAEITEKSLRESLENNIANAEADADPIGSMPSEEEQPHPLNFEELYKQHKQLVETNLEESKTGKRRKNHFEKITLSVKEQKMELEAARKEDKYVSASFKCYNCAAYFHFKDTYQAHMMRHEESNGEYRCTICSLRFANPAVLRKHKQNHGARYKCKKCSEVVRVRQRATHVRHCIAKKKDSVTCHLCGNVFQGIRNFQQHMKRYHQIRTTNKSYLCNICGKGYNNPGGVRTHMLTHINRKFNCDECSSTFSSPYTLNQHKKKHELKEKELHYCTTCNVGYSTRKSLMAHRRNALAHKESIYRCAVCDRVCPSLHALHSHSATMHARLRHLECAICAAKYSTKKAMVRHMTGHRNEKKRPLCHSCGASFKSAEILKKHLIKVCEKKKEQPPTYEFD